MRTISYSKQAHVKEPAVAVTIIVDHVDPASTLSLATQLYFLPVFSRSSTTVLDRPSSSMQVSRTWFVGDPFFLPSRWTHV
jgi:hypothetical protein